MMFPDVTAKVVMKTDCALGVSFHKQKLKKREEDRSWESKIMIFFHLEPCCILVSKHACETLGETCVMRLKHMLHRYCCFSSFILFIAVETSTPVGKRSLQLFHVMHEIS